MANRVHALHLQSAVSGGMGTLWNLAVKAQSSPVTTPMHACCGLFPALQAKQIRSVRLNLSPAKGPFAGCGLCFLTSFSSAWLRSSDWPSWSGRHSSDGNAVAHRGCTAPSGPFSPCLQPGPKWAGLQTLARLHAAPEQSREPGWWWEVRTPGEAFPAFPPMGFTGTGTGLCHHS